MNYIITISSIDVAVYLTSGTKLFHYHTSALHHMAYCTTNTPTYCTTTLAHCTTSTTTPAHCTLYHYFSTLKYNNTDTRYLNSTGTLSTTPAHCPPLLQHTVSVHCTTITPAARYTILYHYHISILYH